MVIYKFFRKPIFFIVLESCSSRSKKKKSKYQIITDSDLVNDAAIVIKGEDISSLKPRTWDWVLRHREIVFARTTPEHKLRIVKVHLDLMLMNYLTCYVYLYFRSAKNVEELLLLQETE